MVQDVLAPAEEIQASAEVHTPNEASAAAEGHPSAEAPTPTDRSNTARLLALRKQHAQMLEEITKNQAQMLAAMTKNQEEIEKLEAYETFASALK